MFIASSSSLYSTVGGTPTIFAALVAVVIARYYWKKGKETKQLGWAPIGITRIVTRPVGDLSEGLALTWRSNDPDAGDIVLKTPYSIKLRIFNDGTRGIPRDCGNHETYDKPLSVNFKSSTCYEATITTASEEVVFLDSSGSPAELPIRVISDPRRCFHIQMPALNRAAWIELQMIADGKIEYPRVECILNDATRQIEPMAERQHRPDAASITRYTSIGTVISASGFALYGYQSVTFSNPTFWPVGLMIIGALVIIFTNAIYAWYWLTSYQKRQAIKRDDPNVFDLGPRRQRFTSGFWRK